MKIEISSNDLRRLIRGALRATENDHGKIEVGSALKRIMGQIEGRQRMINKTDKTDTSSDALRGP